MQPKELQKTETNGQGKRSKIFLEEYSSDLLPHPQHLERYQDIYPDAASRIFEMAKSQQDHQQSLDLKNTENQFKLLKRGQNFAFTLVVAFLLAFVFCVYRGAEWAAGFLGAVGLLGIVKAFMSTGKNEAEGKEE